jgi:hypothetical protein
MLQVKKIGHILTGWGKRFGLIDVSAANAKLSELRLTLCLKCPDAKSSKVLEIINGSGEYTDRLFCDRCKCPCLEKSLVLDENCPIAKW